MYQAVKERANLDQIGVARLTALVANMFRDRSLSPLSAEDFLPFRPAIKELTIEESEAALVAFTYALGGKDLRNGNNG